MLVSMQLWFGDKRLRLHLPIMRKNEGYKNGAIMNQSKNNDSLIIN